MSSLSVVFALFWASEMVEATRHADHYPFGGEGPAGAFWWYDSAQTYVFHLALTVGLHLAIAFAALIWRRRWQVVVALAVTALPWIPELWVPPWLSGWVLAPVLFPFLGEPDLTAPIRWVVGA